MLIHAFFNTFLNLLFDVMKESQGVRMMYKLLQIIESNKQYIFTTKDYNKFHKCVDIYETYLSKTATQKRTGKFESYSKRHIKNELRHALRTSTLIEDKMQCLSNVMYTLGNYEANVSHD